MRITSALTLPGRRLRVGYDPAEGRPGADPVLWRLTNDAGVTYYPVAAEFCNDDASLILRFRALPAGEYTLHGPEGTSLAAQFDPLHGDWYWLDIKGLPAHPSPLAAPTGARMVVGHEYFADAPALCVGASLDLAGLCVSGDAVQVNLVDLDGRLVSLFRRGQGKCARVLRYDSDADVAALASCLGAVGELLWTDLGEAVKVLSAGDDGELPVLTLGRARHGSARGLLRAGSLLYDAPPAGSLRAELWRYDDEHGSCRLYAGLLTDIIPAASGLTWRLTFRDFLSASSVLRTASGVTMPTLIPWAWDLWPDDHDGGAQVIHLTACRTPRLLDLASLTRDPGVNGQRALSRAFWPAVITGLTPEIGDDGVYRVTLELTHTVGARVLDESGHIRQAPLDLRFMLEREDLASFDQHWSDLDARPLYFGEHLRWQAHADADEALTTHITLRYPTNMAFPLPLLRDPEAIASTPDGADLSTLWDNRAGYFFFLNRADASSAGYWDAYPGAEQPLTVVNVEGLAARAFGASRALIYDRWDDEVGLSYGSRRADILKLDEHRWSDESVEVAEAVPYAQNAYLWWQVPGSLATGLRQLLAGGRDDATHSPPRRGFGVPSDCVDLAAIPALSGLSVQGWRANNLTPAAVLTDLARCTGVVTGPRPDGVIAAMAGLWAPSATDRAVTSLAIDDLLAAPDLLRIEPAAAGEIELLLDNDTYLVRQVGGASSTRLKWELPGFADASQSAATAARLLRLTSRSHPVLRLATAEHLLPGDLGPGGWLRLKGALPGVDADDARWLLVLSVRSYPYRRRVELECLALSLTEAGLSGDAGLHWGSPIAQMQIGAQDRVTLFLPASYGADDGGAVPPGLEETGLRLSLFDGRRRCDDHFILENHLSRCILTDADDEPCYRLDARYDRNGASICGLHSVAAGAGTENCALADSGDWRAQFRIGRQIRFFAADGALLRATVTGLSLVDGYTCVAYTGLAEAPAADSLCVSELVEIRCAAAADLNPGSPALLRHFFAAPENPVLPSHKAPGFESFSVAAFDESAGELRIAGDLRTEFDDVAVVQPALNFSPPRCGADGEPIRCTAMRYDAAAHQTVLTLLHCCGGGVTPGDRVRDERAGGSWRHARINNVTDDIAAFLYH